MTNVINMQQYLEDAQPPATDWDERTGFSRRRKTGFGAMKASTSSPAI